MGEGGERDIRDIWMEKKKADGISKRMVFQVLFEMDVEKGRGGGVLACNSQDLGLLVRTGCKKPHINASPLPWRIT